MRARWGEHVRRTLVVLVRSSLVFALCVLLVAGFYFHSTFYSMGLVPLLILGGLVTTFVVAAFRFVLTGELPRGPAVGDLEFPLQVGNAVLQGAVRASIIPLERDTPLVGEILRARYPTGLEFGRLLVEDVARVYASDLSADDARKAGHLDRDTLRASDGEDLAPDSVVALVSFRRLGGTR